MPRSLLLPSLILALLLMVGCQPQPAPAQTDSAAPAPVRTGAHVLSEAGFGLLAGKRVGLIVNHTALVDTTHLIDLVHEAEGVELGALFGPEHGLRGGGEAGEKMDDGVDDRTGVPVFSLYGANRKPNPEHLAGLDALVFDIQDIGARFYTYISTMGLAMQSAAENGLEFYVLDRPNPIGGAASGFMLEPEHESFVGQYPIPIAHGLTVGELADMIKGEALLPGLDELELTVVPVENWNRDVLWPATGLTWTETSPNIPDFETALVYAGTCFFEGVTASEGRGTETPFTLLGAPWVDGQALADTLNAAGLAGLTFEPATFTTRDIPGMATDPKHEGVEIQGVRLVVEDAVAVQPVDAGVHVLHAFYAQAPAEEKATFFKSATLNRLAGTAQLQTMLEAGASPAAIIASWQDGVDAFLEQRRPYERYAISE